VAWDGWRRLNVLRELVLAVNTTAMAPDTTPIDSDNANFANFFSRILQVVDVCTGGCAGGCFLHLVSLGKGDKVWDIEPAAVAGTIRLIIGKSDFLHLPPSGHKAKLLEAFDGCDMLQEMGSRAGQTGVFEDGKFKGPVTE